MCVSDSVVTKLQWVIHHSQTLDNHLEISKKYQSTVHCLKSYELMFWRMSHCVTVTSKLLALLALDCCKLYCVHTVCSSFLESLNCSTLQYRDAVQWYSGGQCSAEVSCLSE